MHPRPEIELGEDQKRLLRTLRNDEPRSRIELSRLLDINNGVITRLSRELISLGLVSEAEAQAGARGRPSLPLHLRPNGAYAIGAATHPGWIDISVVDFAGNPLAQKSCPWDEGEPQHFAQLLSDEVDAITANLRLRHARFLGFGISVPGFSVGSRAQRHTVERMHSWRGHDLSTLLSEALGGPVWIENDANAAAIAEYYQAGRREGSSMLVLFLGHGVGAGCISDDQLFPGEYANAGEIGVLYPLDRPRPSAVDLVQTLEANGGGRIGLRHLAEPLVQHEDIVEEWIARAAEQLELAVLSGIAWLDPASIVISGTLPDRVLDGLANRLRDIGWGERLGGRQVPPIKASLLQGRAAAIGAALLPIHHLIAP
ncbi:ROK family protein [Novosphingobium album (ex Liu et al. 2023)]|uniref:ROK family protein n=1 Tax=Novosphingobium album (ex Liu et al. 2023) TaxID=3031130 RepID=A0ABT5WLZ6_9SPHN|nr:ROK family transcriptional regulator [Novosphingobium album (ex Liu et al. 2023)]MDE8650711.1 ROK family protein [Novosphingobium album (ex Liu et al. 2023)]